MKAHKVSEDLLKTPRMRSCEHGGEINCVSWAKEGEGTKDLDGFFFAEVYELGSCSERATEFGVS